MASLVVLAPMAIWAYQGRWDLQALLAFLAAGGQWGYLVLLAAATRDPEGPLARLGRPDTPVFRVRRVLLDRASRVSSLSLELSLSLSVHL